MLLTRKSERHYANNSVTSKRAMREANIAKVEYGDWQTSMPLAKAVCDKLYERGWRPSVIIEPTCGTGNFAMAALEVFKNTLKKVYCVEINREYVEEAERRLLNAPKADGVEIEYINGDIFGLDLDKLKIGNQEEVVVLGNPPWVTNSKMGRIEGRNLPKKTNYKKMRGIDAITGKGGYDIAESVIVKLASELPSDGNVKMALLVKTSVVKSIVETVARGMLHDIVQENIDTKQEFGAAVSACLFTASTGTGGKTCEVRDFYTGKHLLKYRWEEGKFVSDIDKYSRVNEIDGKSQLEWRSGLKHDCSKVMELKKCDNGYVNGLGERVEIEDDMVFPLMKSSDLCGGRCDKPRSYVIVPQRFAGEETSMLQTTHPLAYSYLEKHSEMLDKRKSSIYKGKPRFSIFGIGDYSFSPHKIAIAGLYGSPKFMMIDEIDGKSVILDDTCYQLAFNSRRNAEAIYKLLTDKMVGDFIETVSFADSKRKISKSLLMRIDLLKVAERMLRERKLTPKETQEVMMTLTSKIG